LRGGIDAWVRSLSGYAVAVGVVAGSAAVTRLLWDAGDHAIFTLFIGAVAISAWFGGLGPGLAATALSGLVTAFLLLPPSYSPAIARDSVLRLLVFTFVAMLTSALHAATRRAQEEQRRAKDAAESASVAKDRFLAMVSHELRNPLNPVMLTVSSLESDLQLPEHVKNDVGIIRRNVELEVRLINDLLDLARCATGKLNLRRRPTDVHQPLAAAVEVCRQELHSKQIQLKLEQASEDVCVFGDAGRLEQVFWNLLRNAIKFTPDGGRITLRTSRPLAADRVVIDISDTGIGIEPERLQTIFVAFEQGGADIFARFGGLGLGLAISRALCEAHGGTIVASSAGKNLGATFTVTLPALPAIASHAPAADHSEAVKQPVGR
jgi:signal transduction histidine kinase